VILCMGNVPSGRKHQTNILYAVQTLGSHATTCICFYKTVLKVQGHLKCHFLESLHAMGGLQLVINAYSKYLKRTFLVVFVATNADCGRKSSLPFEISCVMFLQIEWAIHINVLDCKIA
jgi:hypothetical protein